MPLSIPLALKALRRNHRVAGLCLVLGLGLAGCSHLERLSGSDFDRGHVPDVVYARVVQDCSVNAAVGQNEMGIAHPTYTYNRIFSDCMRHHGFAATGDYGLGLF